MHVLALCNLGYIDLVQAVCNAQSVSHTASSVFSVHASWQKQRDWRGSLKEKKRTRPHLHTQGCVDMGGQPRTGTQLWARVPPTSLAPSGSSAEYQACGEWARGQTRKLKLHCSVYIMFSLACNMSPGTSSITHITCIQTRSKQWMDFKCWQCFGKTWTFLSCNIR